MNRSRLSLGWLVSVAMTGTLLACGATPGDDLGGAGGSSAGGAPAAGGVQSTGGGFSTGGAPNAGGASNAGGSPSAGGAPNAGGAPSTGGSPNAGGSPSAGGAPAAGGAPSAGGGPSTGGGSNPGGGSWGEVENPSAGCTIGPLPSFASLTANKMLPDPFKKMDGTRITMKSEWLCRREEILQQMFEFIYGDKPAPESVSGTVSNTSISVQAQGSSGTANFSVSVNMNGATAPAPAIIRYGNSGASAPSGVATINFTATETTGGSGAKSGPFYTAYGSNHPAGYLVAQAWQISRILDVLEKNPGTIDPYRIGVTGCSRLGKGAFVAGVLDNRIALTIPVESGLGGTIGLRLVEQLDTSGEWPYHGISYVRWLSEVALGQFTNGNNAGADNTDKLPVDMHEAMGLIAPRGLYIVDNPSNNYAGLDKNSAWVTGKVGQMIFEALGVGDHIAYQGASGGHCTWRTQYNASLDAMVNKFLKGMDGTATGNFATDLPNPPNHETYIDWDPPTLSGEL